ncbi:S9 family peptidase [Bacillus pinisoli]|uniref:S9 family peptidase n=1 Tax=Bacillus pinisoli TaxID=2901866 RepID=UPI001FF550EA|nr:prolyl oligopeptidase family serine peptidase [Bacillus pinisoli]
MITFPKTGIESFFRTVNIVDFDVHSSEEEIIYSTNLNGYYNIWAMNLVQRYPFQLTTANQMNSFVKYNTKIGHILTGYDYDGDENYHIYALQPTGGEAAPLLKAEGEKFYYGDLSKDGKTLYYVTSVENPNFLSIRRINLVNGENEVLVNGEGGPSYLYAVSPDESSIAFSKEVGNTSSFGYVLQNGESIAITPSQEKPHRVKEVEYVDANHLLVLTNYESEFTYLASFDISSRTFKKLFEIEGHELSNLTLDRTREKVYFIAQRGVEDHLYSLELNTLKPRLIEKPFDMVDKLVIGENGTFFALGRSTTKPANIFRSHDLTEWEQLTQHQIIGVKQEELAEPEVLTYPSFDGMKIESLYFAPPKEIDNGHTILWPHGGPQWAVRKTFSPLFQYLVTQGFRVFSPNFRGSTGYGESFMKLVNKDWGGGPRLDIVAGMEWLNQQGKSSEDKWFCIGGSYGGYMTLLLHGRHADLFKGFVDIFGPSNLFTTIETAPEHWKAADRELIGDAVEDREKLIEDSPMTYIDQMTKPMLVIQGANDPRVVKVESDVIVEAMKQRGQDVEYLILEDEGHGFSKTENALKVYSLMVNFIKKYI